MDKKTAKTRKNGPRNAETGGTSHDGRREFINDLRNNNLNVIN
jgi:hypothetical protein